MDKQKQKQIEEMAKVICGKYNNGGCEIDGYVCNLRCDSRIRAEICYEKCYRKIPENAVVLTREEYDDMFSFKTTSGGCYNILDTVRKVERKETAEKIYTFINSFGTSNWERFKNFLKQFDVE